MAAAGHARNPRARATRRSARYDSAFPDILRDLSRRAERPRPADQESMQQHRTVAFTLLCVVALLGGTPPRAAEIPTWHAESAQPARFVAVHGRRSAVFGYSENGLEVW